MQHSEPSLKDVKVPPRLTQTPAQKHSKGRGKVQGLQEGECKTEALWPCAPPSRTTSPTDSLVDADMKGRAVSTLTKGRSF